MRGTQRRTGFWPGLAGFLVGFLAGFLAGFWLGLAGLDLFFSMFFSSPCGNAAAGHFASISRGRFVAATRLVAVLSLDPGTRLQVEGDQK